jgi:hypothetical protein
MKSRETSEVFRLVFSSNLPVLRIPGSEFFPSRIQGQKDSRIPDLQPHIGI